MFGPALAAISRGENLARLRRATRTARVASTLTSQFRLYNSHRQTDMEAPDDLEFHEMRGLRIAVEGCVSHPLIGSPGDSLTRFVRDMARFIPFTPLSQRLARRSNGAKA